MACRTTGRTLIGVEKEFLAVWGMASRANVTGKLKGETERGEKDTRTIDSVSSEGRIHVAAGSGGRRKKRTASRTSMNSCSL